MSLESVFNTYLGFRQIQNRSKYQDEQVRLADARLDFDKDRHRESVRQWREDFDQKQINDAIRNTYTEVNSERISLGNIEDQRKLEKTAADETADYTVNTGLSHAGTTNAAGNSIPLLTRGEQGLIYNDEALQKLLFVENDRAMRIQLGEALDRTLGKLYGPDSPQVKGEYSYAEAARQGLLLHQTRTEDGSDAGKKLYGITGVYKNPLDGEDDIGNMTTGGTRAAGDLTKEASQEWLMDVLKEDLRTNILTTDFGSNYNDALMAKFGLINSEVYQVEKALNNLRKDTMEATAGISLAKGNTQYARNLYDAFLEKSDADKNAILVDISKEYSWMKLDPLITNNLEALTEGSDILIPEGAEPDTILSDRGESIGPVGTAVLTPEFRKQFHEEYGIRLDPNPRAIVQYPHIAKKRHKQTIQEAKGYDDFDKKLAGTRDEITLLDREIVQLDKDILALDPGSSESAKARVNLESKIEKRQDIINQTNADLYNHTKKVMDDLNGRIERTTDPDDKAELEEQLKQRTDEFDELVKAGMVTKTMQTDAYKALTKKIWGEDGEALIEGGESFPKEVRALLEKINKKFGDGAIKFTKEEVNLARKAAEENLVTNLDRLKSTSLHNLVMAKVMMMASTDNAVERQSVSSAIDNIILTGDPSLTTKQLSDIETSRATAETNYINAETRAKQNDRIINEQIRRWEKEDNQREAKKWKAIRKGYDEAYNFIYETTLPGGLTPKMLSMKFANRDYEGAGIEAEFSAAFDSVSEFSNRFVDYNSEGTPIRINNQKAFDLMEDHKEAMAINLIQHKAKQGIFNDFETLFNTNSLKNLRADNTDPRKMTKLFFVDDDGIPQGDEVPISELRQLGTARDYLMTKVFLNELRNNTPEE